MKKNRFVRRTLKITAMVVCCILLSEAIGFAVYPVTYNHIFLHQWKEQAGETDTIVIGDSLTLRSVQPSILDEQLNCSSFNTATASQSLKISYYYLKSILQECDLSTVYLGLDYYNFLMEDLHTVQAANLVLERIRNPLQKAEFLFNLYEVDDLFDLVFDFRLNRNGIYNIKDNLTAKFSPAYFRYEITDVHDHNTDKGYAFSDQTGLNLDVENSNDLVKIRPENFDWLEQIITLCKTNGVIIRLFQSPYSQARMKLFENYDYYHDHICRVAEKNGVSFCDFNYYHDRAQLKDDVCFKDMAHLNYTGSTLFMEWFCTAYQMPDAQRSQLFVQPKIGG